MKKNYPIIHYGELVAGFYFKYNEKKAYIEGAGVGFNILHTCSFLGNSSHAISVMANDSLSNVCIDSLKKANVSIDKIVIDKKGYSTTRIFIEKFKDNYYKKHVHCPKCGNTNHKKIQLQPYNYTDRFFDGGIIIYDNFSTRIHKEVVLLKHIREKFQIVLIIDSIEEIRQLLAEMGC